MTEEQKEFEKSRRQDKNRAINEAIAKKEDRRIRKSKVITWENI